MTRHPRLELAPQLDERWKARGLCGDDPRPDDWFPRDTDDNPWPNHRRAVATCYRCPVMAQCGQYAIAAGEAGIWGGLTEEQRRAMRRAATRRALREGRSA